MADERKANSAWRAGSRRKLWGAVWLVVALSVFQSGYWEPNKALAERETWPLVAAEVVSSEVAFNSTTDQYELRVRLSARSRGAILHDEMPKRQGKESQLQEILERDFQVGTSVNCRIDPANPNQLFVPSTQGYRPILLGLVPSILLACLGLMLLLTSARQRNPA